MGKILKIATIGTMITVLALIGYLSFYYITDSKKESPAITDKAEETKDEAASWPVYINEKFGFSVKYPDGWQKKEEDETHITFTDPKSSKNILLSYHEESLESVLERGFVGPTRNIRENEIAINGKIVKRISAQFLLEDIGQGEKWSDEDTIFTYFPNEGNNKVVVISSDISNQEIYEKILSTIVIK